ncbi:MAG: hypothetical protein ACXVZJ_08935 [Terriglobales bacterium]
MQQLVDDIASAIRMIDRSRIPFKTFQPGAGPYGEPQLVKLITKHLFEGNRGQYVGIRTCRTPDVLIPSRWALEFKVVRPFGDNGIEAEHWSQNLLHPYPGNVSAIGDAIKLMKCARTEEKALIVISYEHDPPKIDLSVLISAFELISRELLRLPLGRRHVSVVGDCIHPVHRRATIYGWQLKLN